MAYFSGQGMLLGITRGPTVCWILVTAQDIFSHVNDIVHRLPLPALSGSELASVGPFPKLCLVPI